MKINGRYFNIAAWITIILTYIMPYRTTDGFATGYGFPVPYLTIYDHGAYSRLEVNLLSTWAVNVAGLLLNMLIFYIIILGIHKLEEKYRIKRRVSYVVLFAAIALVALKGSNDSALEFVGNGKEIEEVVTEGHEIEEKSKIDVEDQDGIIEKEYIKLFIPDRDITYWLIEEREIECNPLKVLEELFKEPFLDDVEILGIYIEDRIAYLDLSNTFEFTPEGFGQGDLKVYIRMKSIANTLCLNEELAIDAVCFMIEGESREGIGPVIFDGPVQPNTTLNYIN